MPKKSITTRRQFLATCGAAAAGGMLALRNPVRMPVEKQAALPERPNLLFIVTDQERAPQHWPPEFDLAARLPARQKLLDEGLCFNRAFCNSSMCSPSRATLITGLYAPQHRLTRTLTYIEDTGSQVSNSETPLSPQLPNLARMLASAGYYVALKGKWHLSKDAEGNAPGAEEVAAFGFHDWEATTAGEATAVDSFGGGCAQNDALIVDQALAWLGQASLPQPFALFVMLANPHDVLAYPSLMDDESCAESYANTADWTWGIELPDTFGEDLTVNKPAVQNASLGLYNLVLGPLNSLVEQRKYVNFYAYLHTLVDAQINRLLAALDGWSDDQRPVIIRTADHGEMGLAHGGLRQKMFNAYEETIHVPLIISHPNLPSKGQATGALASLVDILPTVASLVGAAHPDNMIHSGVDLTPVIQNPSASVQDTILFTFDDDRAGTAMDPGVLTTSAIAHHIRCIRSDYNGQQWKFARYFNPPGENAVSEEFELYNLSEDPSESHNLYSADTPLPEQAVMAERLAQAEAERLSPLSFNYIPAVRA